MMPGREMMAARTRLGMGMNETDVRMAPGVNGRVDASASVRGWGVSWGQVGHRVAEMGEGEQGAGLEALDVGVKFGLAPRSAPRVVFCDILS